MADIKTVRQAFGGSVNDVLLAAITAGFRHLLQVRGEEPEPRAVRTLVPVSMRASGDEGTMNNQVSLMLPFLPVHVADPVERLRAVRAALEERKQGGEAQAGARLTTLAEDLPFLPVSLGVRLAARLPQRNITTVTTNVPGPPMQLTLLGRPIRELFPLVPIATTIRFGLAIMSYHDAIGFGVTADYDNASDVDLLARSIENGLGELVAAAEPRKKPARRRRAKQ
jgi:diacylglycerol O-acyltransferase